MWYKRTIPLILVFTLGLAGFVAEYIPHPAAGVFREEISSWLRIASGFGLFIGIYSLLHMHVGRIRRRTPGWGYSGFVFLGAAGMIAMGLYNGGVGPMRPAPAGTVTMFEHGYNFVYVPCTATIFSILAFFMASAAFRTFRARTFSAFLLLAAAVVVMFGRVPVSEVCGGWFGHPNFFSNAADILMEYPNTAAQRGVLLGVSLGAIAQSLRILFGIERSYMGGGQ